MKLEKDTLNATDFFITKTTESGFILLVQDKKKLFSHVNYLLTQIYWKSYCSLVSLHLK